MCCKTYGFSKAFCRTKPPAASVQRIAPLNSPSWDRAAAGIALVEDTFGRQRAS
jgi:hypothetical protein